MYYSSCCSQSLNSSTHLLHQYPDNPVDSWWSRVNKWCGFRLPSKTQLGSLGIRRLSEEGLSVQLKCYQDSPPFNTEMELPASDTAVEPGHNSVASQPQLHSS